MEELKTQPYGVTTANVGQTSKDKSGKHLFETPVWVTVVRGFQIFFGFVILILAGILIHGLAMDAVCFALACGLFTWIVSFYSVLTEKITSWRTAYNHWAVLSLDIFMTILWLASMGAVAALRTSFKYDVNADCYDDGSAVNAGHCVVYKRSLEKRFAVASQAGLATMSAIAGLSALEMLLFIATLAYLAHQIRLHYRSNKSSDAATVEMNAQQQQPMLSQQTPAAAPASTYSDQAQYPNTQYTGAHGQQAQYTSPPAQLYDGYAYPQQTPQQTQQHHQQQQPAYQYPQEVSAQQQGYGQSPVAYTPSASPAPTYVTNQAPYPAQGQIYQPPQQ